MNFVYGAPPASSKGRKLGEFLSLELPLSEAPAAERHAALVVAIDRLCALGVDATRLRIDAFAFAKQQRQVLLLDPTQCGLERVTAGAGRATARELATRLLD